MSTSQQEPTPEDIFKSIIWRSTVEIADPLEKFTNWTITGVAAIAGLIIGNLDALSNIVSPFGLKLSLVSFAGSLFCGVISRQMGIFTVGGIRMVRNIESTLLSPDGLKIVNQCQTPVDKMIPELCRPFSWPLRKAVFKGASEGATDFFRSDRKFVQMFCQQVRYNIYHGAFGLFGLIIIPLSFK